MTRKRAAIVLFALLLIISAVSCAPEDGNEASGSSEKVIVQDEKKLDSAQSEAPEDQAPAAEVQGSEDESGDALGESSPYSAEDGEDSAEDGEDSEEDGEGGSREISLSLSGASGTEEENAEESGLKAEDPDSSDDSESMRAGEEAGEAASGEKAASDSSAEKAEAAQSEGAKDGSRSGKSLSAHSAEADTAEKADSAAQEPEPARITLQPENADVKAGESAVFRVSAEGTGLSYRWEKKKPLEESWQESRAEGSRSSVLKVTEVKGDWNGMQYRCRVTDKAGNEVYSRTVKLNVLSVSNDPEAQFVKAGKRVAFKADASGAGLSYQWQRMTPDGEVWENLSGASQKKLVYEQAKARWNRYRFRCRIIDAAGKTVYTRAARLYVLSVKSNPKTVYIKEGQKGSFRVSASGGGLKYQWQIKKSSDSDWKNSSSDGNQSVKLQIQGSRSRNGYYIRCRVTDGGGNVEYTGTARLYVLAVTKNPSNKSVKAGSTASFSVKATGGGIKYQWQCKTPSESGWKNYTGSGQHSSVIKVYAKSSRNQMRFRCRVTDKHGNTVYSNKAVLYVASITQNPSTKKIKTGETAVFRVAAKGAGLKYSWQMRESSGRGWKSTSASGHKTSTLRVKGQTSYNGYQFRCKVTASGGHTMYSKAATLYVLGITNQPSDLIKRRGRTAVFDVRAVGSGLKYQWQVNKNSGGWKNTVLEGNRSSTLYVPAAISRDGYRFRCRIKDSWGNVIYTRGAYLWVE